jgi:DNA polymerase III delta prime subunit
MTKKFKIPVGEIFSFFGLLDIDIDDAVSVNRVLKIKDQHGKFNQINYLIKKEGMVKKYELEDGITIKCDEKHLVRSNGEFKHISVCSEVDTIFGSKKILNTIDDCVKYVYDFSLDTPHEYITSGGVICHNTTLAKMIVNSIECDYMVINASDENNVDTVRTKVKNFASTVGFKDMKIVILDEFDYMTANAQAILRNLMETFSKHCRFILTCNYIEKVIDPIQSRCQTFQIVPPTKKDVAVHIAKILKLENVEFDINDIVTFVDASYPDIRKIINTIQLNSQKGKLKISSDSVLNGDLKNQLVDVLKSKDEKRNKYMKIRQLMADNRVQDFSEFYTLLYEKVDEYAGGNTSNIIIAISEGQYKDALVIDKEITFMATLINILEILG